MTTYHKIPTVWKRDPDNNFKTLLPNVWATEELAYLAHNDWEFTEKIDGTNIRVVWRQKPYVGARPIHPTADDMLLYFAGRTDRAQIPAFLEKRLNRLFDKEEMFEVFGSDPFVLYGEGYGNKIQKVGKQYLPDGVDFILFDVQSYSPDREPVWLRRDDIFNIGSRLGLDIVPIVGLGTLTQAIRMAQLGYSSVIADTNLPAEGLVMRPTADLLDRNGNRIIAKIKMRDFQ